MNSKISTVSLFSGAGGFDFGFEKTAKFQTVAAIESNPTYFKTLINNQGSQIHKEVKFMENAQLLNECIENCSGSRIRKSIKKYIENDLFAIIGGPPCQSFSTIGKRSGLNDERGLLIFEFSRIVKEAKPTFFVFENVPNMAQQWKGKVLKRLLNEFDNAGYKYVFGILNAADYGAYTKRKRLIIIGTNNHDIDLCLPSPTHQKPKRQNSLFEDKRLDWCKVKDLLEKLPDPFTKEALNLAHHKPVNHTQKVIERFKNLDIGKQDKIRKRWKLDPNLPSPSLMAGGNGGYVFHIHYKYPRDLTSRECATIQGFPIEFEFHGKPLDVAKQIVNAIPIQLSEAIANHIFGMITK